MPRTRTSLLRAAGGTALAVVLIATVTVTLGVTLHVFYLVLTEVPIVDMRL